MSEAPASQPLVTVVLTTRDRPLLLPVALACYGQQTYSPRELIVVDDGSDLPADSEAVAAAGGRLLRVKPGTPLGIKLNLGVQEARGRLVMKMDDDDWYSPAYIETMVSAMAGSSARLCRPAVAFLAGFLFFDVEHWEIRRSVDNNIPGASLFFARDDWEERPFRPLSTDEDVWFLIDQVNAGREMLPVRSREVFMAVRHRAHSGNRGHTWTHQFDGRTLETYLNELNLQEGGPESLLPDWALAVYRELHQEMVGAKRGFIESASEPAIEDSRAEAPTSVS